MDAVSEPNPERRVESYGQNATLNLVGQIAVAMAGLLCLPPIIRGLHQDAYGLLSLALSAFALSALLDLGLGRATTNAVAECIGRDEKDSLSAVFWLSLLLQSVIGICAATVIFLSAPALASTALRIPASLRHSALLEFRLIALAVPFIVLSSAFRGVLEGIQRFDLVNLVRVPLNASVYILPLAGIWTHLGVPAIIGTLVASRVVGTAAYVVGCRLALPHVFKRVQFKRSTFKRLISYSGWTSITNIIVPVYTQLDRYFIGAMVGVGALTYYSVPFEILNGLFILPMSIVSSLFPVVSGLQKHEVRPHLVAIYGRPIKYILFSLGPVAFVLAAIAPDILRLWQGPVFASRSALVLQILLAGLVINSVGWVPACLLNGMVRPDVGAKILVAELPVYFGLAYVLISHFGIVGAALTFTIRVAFETGLYFIASFLLQRGAARALVVAIPIRALPAIATFAVAAFAMQRLSGSITWHIASAMVLLAGCIGFLWRYVMDASDRRFIKESLSVRRISLANGMIRDEAQAA
ncbi:MAG: flippase [Acidobacteriaceae bacterium]|nr:flippase [Acidobacteriaceae bacterium]